MCCCCGFTVYTGMVCICVNTHTESEQSRPTFHAHIGEEHLFITHTLYTFFHGLLQERSTLLFLLHNHQLNLVYMHVCQWYFTSVEFHLQLNAGQLYSFLTVGTCGWWWLKPIQFMCIRGDCYRAQIFAYGYSFGNDLVTWRLSLNVHIYMYIVACFLVSPVGNGGLYLG